MFERLKLKRDIKTAKYLKDTAHKGAQICKANLYEIEHDSLPDFEKEYAIKTYGSVEEYKKYYEEKLDENEKIYNKYLNQLVELEMKLRKLNKK